MPPPRHRYLMVPQMTLTPRLVLELATSLPSLAPVATNYELVGLMLLHFYRWALGCTPEDRFYHANH